jgi:hypothetical protein
MARKSEKTTLMRLILTVLIPQNTDSKERKTEIERGTTWSNKKSSNALLHVHPLRRCSSKMRMNRGRAFSIYPHPMSSKKRAHHRNTTDRDVFTGN